MCGIAGLIDLASRRPVPEGVLSRMSAVLVHRGPDEEGSLERPGLGLACRRLSIVGLKDGRQPIPNEDRQVWVVFNGELFDYPEMRRTLEGRGHVFATHCDTELLPHLWEEHGEGLFDRVRGQFAFALWDGRRGRLVLARDRFGICPLYWARVQAAGGPWLLFASEVKALLASGMVQARPDPRGIHQLFTFLGVPGPVTCFEGIQALLPGYYLSVQLDEGGAPARVEERAYWQIDFPDEGDETWGDDPGRLVEDFEAVLFRAVERRLRADVPVVSYLSGGVDSSLVAAMAGKALGRPIPTFTVGVEDRELDETAHALAVARHVGGTTTLVPYGSREMLHLYPELIRAAEAPVIDTSAAAALLLARRVHADGYKVALAGEGADEWLAGYPWLAATPFIRWLSRFPGLSLVGPVTRLHLWSVGAPPGTYDLVRRAEAVLGGQNPWLVWAALISQSGLRFFSAAMKERLAGHEPFADLRLDAARLRRWHLLHRGLGVGARTLLAGMLLSSKGDRVGMHSSVELRYPFLDEEVFTFLAGLHPRWKRRGLRAKYLLRKVAERWLPREIAWRPKAMFRAPLDPFHAPHAPALFAQLLRPEALRRSGYFDAEAVGRWRQRYRTLRAGSPARAGVEMGLVGVVATQLWHHLFIDRTLAEVQGPAATP
jgi:asparagine synthase (glutamine-hydrolysing)